VTTFALTDHDTIAGCKCASELGREAGVTVIPGVEISAVDPKRHGKAHILCYKPKKPEVLLPLLQKTTDSRHAAMLRSVDKVCRLYAIPRDDDSAPRGGLDEYLQAARFAGVNGRRLRE